MCSRVRCQFRSHFIFHNMWWFRNIHHCRNVHVQLMRARCPRRMCRWGFSIKVRFIHTCRAASPNPAISRHPQEAHQLDHHAEDRNYTQVVARGAPSRSPWCPLPSLVSIVSTSRSDFLIVQLIHHRRHRLLSTLDVLASNLCSDLIILNIILHRSRSISTFDSRNLDRFSIVPWTFLKRIALSTDLIGTMVPTSPPLFLPFLTR